MQQWNLDLKEEYKITPYNLSRSSGLSCGVPIWLTILCIWATGKRGTSHRELCRLFFSESKTSKKWMTGFDSALTILGNFLNVVGDRLRETGEFIGSPMSWKEIHESTLRSIQEVVIICIPDSVCIRKHWVMSGQWVWISGLNWKCIMHLVTINPNYTAGSFMLHWCKE